MDDIEKTSMPVVVPSKEECDAEYSKARTSLDGRASPFVPGVGLRLSEEFKPIDLNDTTAPDEIEAEVSHRGKFVTRTHRSVSPLSETLNAAETPVDGSNAEVEVTRTLNAAETPVDGSNAEVEVTRHGKFVTRTHRSVSPLSDTLNAAETPVDGSNAEVEVTRHGKFVTRTHRSVSPLTTEPETPPPAEREGGQAESPDMDTASPPPLPETPPEREAGQAETPGMDTASPPPLPPRPEEDDGDDGSCDCGTTDPVTKVSAWEQTSFSRVSGAGSSGGSGRINSASIRVSPAQTLDLRIFCGTWNVAGRKVDSVEDMGLWLDVDKLDDEGGASDPPDLFVIGFQEVVELSAQNVVMDSFLDTQSRANSLQWFAHAYAYLAQYGQRHGLKYAMVSEQRLLGTYVLVMATEAVCTRIAHVQSAIIPTGLGGYLGNKGAVAVRMEVAGASSLCFVCVHMAAHRENVLARNAEYKAISTKPVFADTAGRLPVDEAEDASGKDKDKRQGSTWGNLFGVAGQGGRSGGMSPTRNSEVKKAIRAAMAFGLPKGAGKEAGDSPNRDEGVEIDGSRNGIGKGTSGAEQDGVDDCAWVPSVQNMSAGLPKTKTVLQADIVFWLGDLNYRISEEVPDQQVFEMLKTNDLETLRDLDQLNLARASGAAFQEFQEGPLCFPPSYKYIPGTREFDNRPEKKVRCPSWCDRVLYSVGVQGGDSVRRLGLDKYWSSGPLLSDHMPVSALFRTSLACAPEKIVVEPEMDVEPLSPQKAAAKAVFESVPFAKIVLDPPALVLELDQMPLRSAVTEISNVGGMEGAYHVCKDSLPGWMSLDGNERGKLGPGEKVEIGIVIDAAAAAAEAEAASAKEPNGGPRQAFAVLPVEVDGGGSGTLLSVVCMVGEK